MSERNPDSGQGIPSDEKLDEIARAALNDRDAPPCLTIAAWLWLRGYDRSELRGLVRDALALEPDAVLK